MKLPALADPTETADCEIRQLTSDLFHELSQPLTNLCCSLELALSSRRRPKSTDRS